MPKEHRCKNPQRKYWHTKFNYILKRSYTMIRITWETQVCSTYEKSINVVIHHINGMEKDKEQTEHSRGQLETGTWMTTLLWFGPRFEVMKEDITRVKWVLRRGKDQKENLEKHIVYQDSILVQKPRKLQCQNAAKDWMARGPVGLVVGGHAYLTIKSGTGEEAQWRTAVQSALEQHLGQRVRLWKPVRGRWDRCWGESPSGRDFIENGETGAKLLERQQLPRGTRRWGMGVGQEELMRRKGQETRKTRKWEPGAALTALERPLGTVVCLHWHIVHTSQCSFRSRDLAPVPKSGINMVGTRRLCESPDNSDGVCPYPPDILFIPTWPLDRTWDRYCSRQKSECRFRCEIGVTQPGEGGPRFLFVPG